jgi:hypothetical protein
MKRATRPTCDDVIEAFALESESGKATLDRYLRSYPEYAEAILDFATEVSMENVARKEPLSARERGLVETAWEMHVKAAPKPIADPFAVLSGVELGKIAGLLEVPKQVLTALRDRTIIAASIPRRFAKRLAAEIGTDVDALIAFVATPSVLSVVRSRKSDAKPKTAERKPFEQVLIDAGVPVGVRKKLMTGD